MFKFKKTTNEINKLSKGKSKINSKKLVNFLGGIDNIVGIEYTHSKVKVFIANKKTIEIEKIKNIKFISGVFISSKYITIVVGNIAKDLSEKLIANK